MNPKINYKEDILFFSNPKVDFDSQNANWNIANNYQLSI